MAQLPALTQLYAKISDSLTDEDVRNLRAMLTETLGAARVQNAIPIEIFNMLQHDNKISKGNLGLLVQILRSLGKGRLAEEAEQLEQEQRREAQARAEAAMPQADPMALSEPYHTLVPPMPMALAIYPGFQGNFDIAIGEQPHGQLTIPNQHLLTTVYQNEQVLQLKTRMRDEELKALYMYEENKVKSLKRAKAFLSQESLDRKFDELWAKVEEQQAIIVSTYRGCVIMFLTFESEPKFEHFWGSCTSGDLSTTLSELLLTEEMRGTEGGDQLVVRTLVLEKDVRAWRDFFNKGDPQCPQDVQVKQVTSQLANLGTSRLTEDSPVRRKPIARTGSIASIASIMSSDSDYASAESLSQISGGSLSVIAGFTISIQGQAVESLPCSVTVTGNTTVGLIGGDVAPQIEVTSPQGKTTLIQTTAHTSPPLAAGKGQTSRVRRVWGGEWRPTESGKHTLGVCMGVRKDLASLTVDVGSNNPVLRFGQKGSQQGQFDWPRDVAVRGDRLYVADTLNSRVQVFDLSGNFCDSFSTTTKPVSVAVQTDGTIVVNSRYEVMKMSPSGELLHRFLLGEYYTNPYGLAVQRDGRVVVADIGKHSIFLFEADGTLVKQVGGQGKGEGQFDMPCFVCVDKEDHTIVADKDNHRIEVFDKNLNFKHKFGQKGRQPQDMWGPTGVSADSRGNLVLASRGDGTGVAGVDHGRKLQVFLLDGTWVSNISSDGDKLKGPCGVAVTEDGHVFVADPGDHCIRKYRYNIIVTD